MQHHLLDIMHDFPHFTAYNVEQRAAAEERAQAFEFASPEEFSQLLTSLAELEIASLQASAELLMSVLKPLVQLRKKFRGENKNLWLAASIPDRIATLFTRLPENSPARYRLLECLAVGATGEELNRLVNLLLQFPLVDEQALGIALAPLFQHRDYDPGDLFPSLLAGLAHPSLATAVLDLANYLTRSGRVQEHPAAPRGRELATLLGELTQRLQQLEEHPELHAASPQELSRTIAHGVGLAVSLCDALALIGLTDAIPKLNQALELRHRRVRTEAASALARLGEKTGNEELVKLASEPVARLRVLKYAEELGLSEQLEPEYQTPAARAEAELAIWLADGNQFGLPPAHCELVEERTLYWPSYEEPRQCFLFRFQYRFIGEQGTTHISNLGIVGPLVKAISADLTELPLDDVYALFAGWHVEHEDIFEVDAPLLTEPQRVEVARLERRLRDEGCDQLRPLMLCYFFGEKSLVSRVKQRGVEGVALASADDFLIYPTTGPRSLGPAEVLHIYRGRKLLREFNS